MLSVLRSVAEHFTVVKDGSLSSRIYLCTNVCTYRRTGEVSQRLPHGYPVFGPSFDTGVTWYESRDSYATRTPTRNVNEKGRTR